MAEYTLPDLPYDYAALEPHVSAQIMELHHDKHHAAYVTGANQTLEKLAAARDKDDFGAIVGLEKTLAFHISGHVLHSIFWKNQSPDGGDKPDGALGSAIDENFGSFDKFKAHFTQATMTIQGSGWGVPGVRAAGRPADHRAGLRPPEQRRAELGPAAGLRRLGARLLPAVQEREGRLLRRPVERRQLGRRGGPPRRGEGPQGRGLSIGGVSRRVYGVGLIPSCRPSRLLEGQVLFAEAAGRVALEIGIEHGRPAGDTGAVRCRRSTARGPGRRRRGRRPTGPVRTRSAPPRGQGTARSCPGGPFRGGAWGADLAQPL